MPVSPLKQPSAVTYLHIKPEDPKGTHFPFRPYYVSPSDVEPITQIFRTLLGRIDMSAHQRDSLKGILGSLIQTDRTPTGLSEGFSPPGVRPFCRATMQEVRRSEILEAVARVLPEVTRAFAEESDDPNLLKLPEFLFYKDLQKTSKELCKQGNFTEAFEVAVQIGKKNDENPFSFVDASQGIHSIGKSSNPTIRYGKMRSIALQEIVAHLIVGFTTDPNSLSFAISVTNAIPGGYIKVKTLVDVIEALILLGRRDEAEKIADMAVDVADGICGEERCSAWSICENTLGRLFPERFPSFLPFALSEVPAITQ